MSVRTRASTQASTHVRTHARTDGKGVWGLGSHSRGTCRRSGARASGEMKLYTHDARVQIFSIMHDDDDVSLGGDTTKDKNWHINITRVYSGVGGGGRAGWATCKAN